MRIAEVLLAAVFWSCSGGSASSSEVVTDGDGGGKEASAGQDAADAREASVDPADASLDVAAQDAGAGGADGGGADGDGSTKLDGSAPESGFSDGAGGGSGAGGMPSPEEILTLSTTDNLDTEFEPVIRLLLDDNTRPGSAGNEAPKGPRTGALVNGAHLTASSLAGRIGRGLELDGVDDAFVLPDDPAFNEIDTGLTVQAWVRPTSVSGDRRIISKWSPAADGRRSFSLWLTNATDNTATVNFAVSSDGSDSVAVTSATAIPRGDWTHVAATSDGYFLRIFINRSLDSTRDLSASGGVPLRVFDSEAKLVVGNRDEVSTSQHFAGIIDEVYVYPVARRVFGRRYRTTVPTVVPVGEAFDAHIAVCTESGGLLDTATDTVSLEGGGVLSLPVTQHTFGPADRGIHRVPGVQCTREGVHRLTVRVAGDSIVERSNPILCVAPGRLRDEVYWGDMHWHSNIAWDTSDLPHADQSPAFGYAYARDVARLDFTGMAEHGFRLKNPTQDWQTMIDTANDFHDPGQFVTILGHEWRGNAKPDSVWGDGVWGHHIVSFPGFDPAAVTDVEQETSSTALYERGVNVPVLAYPGEEYIDGVLEEIPAPWDLSTTDTRDLNVLWSLVSPFHAILTPHHLGLQPVNCPSCYPPGAIPFLEVYSKWGASEFLHNSRSSDDQARGGPQANDALAAGLRVGFVGGSDSHITMPGRPVPERRENVHYRQPGLTGCWAKALTRKAVWDALTHRGCYATSAERILVWLDVSGASMGSDTVLPTSEVPRIQVIVAGTAPVEVELLRGTEVVHAVPLGSATLVGFRFTDDGCTESCYYRVRVTQADGERAWASAVWVDR